MQNTAEELPWFSCLYDTLHTRGQDVSEWAGFTSTPTQYRLYGRRFYRSKDQTNSIKVL